MDESFSTLIESAKSILILLPTKPYFDQVSAGLSLYLSLRDKKSVSISSPSPVTVELNRLIGINKIATELGNKNLVFSFPGYSAEQLEKVSYDEEEGLVKLVVIPKSGFSAPAKEQIEISYSGISADLIILVGGANESHFPALAQKELEGVKVMHIGTRALHVNPGREVMSFAKPASSTSELVASMIKETGLPIDNDVATNLVMGIEEGSGHFTSSEVTAETFEIFAYLLRSGGQRPPKVKLEAQDFPPGAIPDKPLFAQKEEQHEHPREHPEEQVENKEEVVETPPNDWLQQPKVYKGTSIS